MGRHKALRQLQLPSEVLPFARGDVAELERADPKSGAGSELRTLRARGAGDTGLVWTRTPAARWECAPEDLLFKKVKKSPEKLQNCKTP